MEKTTKVLIVIALVVIAVSAALYMAVNGYSRLQIALAMVAIYVVLGGLTVYVDRRLQK